MRLFLKTVQVGIKYVYFYSTHNISLIIHIDIQWTVLCCRVKCGQEVSDGQSHKCGMSIFRWKWTPSGRLRVWVPGCYKRLFHSSLRPCLDLPWCLVPSAVLARICSTSGPIWHDVFCDVSDHLGTPGPSGSPQFAPVLGQGVFWACTLPWPDMLFVLSFLLSTGYYRKLWEGFYLILWVVKHKWFLSLTLSLDLGPRINHLACSKATFSS